MRRLIMGCLAAVMLALLSGCEMPRRTEPPSTEDKEIEITFNMEKDIPVAEREMQNLSETDLLYSFKEKNDEPILSHFYGDYDHDGVHEMFVVTGELLFGPDNKDMIYGKLWLINSNGVQLAAEDFSGMATEIEIWRFDDQDFLVSTKNTLAGNLTFMWGVSAGSPKKNSISGLGDIRYIDKQLKVFEVAEDAMIVKNKQKGQTTKSYNLFYRSGDIAEYGAILLSKAEFMQYEGAVEILNKLEKDYPLSNIEILYHDNDIIYINIAYTVDEITYQNSAIIRINGAEVLLQEVVEGKYQKAFLKEIAIYPSKWYKVETE